MHNPNTRSKVIPKSTNALFFTHRPRAVWQKDLRDIGVVVVPVSDTAANEPSEPSARDSSSELLCAWSFYVRFSFLTLPCFLLMWVPPTPARGAAALHLHSRRATAGEDRDREPRNCRVNNEDRLRRIPRESWVNSAEAESVRGRISDENGGGRQTPVGGVIQDKNGREDCDCGEQQDCKRKWAQRGHRAMGNRERSCRQREHRNQQDRKTNQQRELFTAKQHRENTNTLS